MTFIRTWLQPKNTLTSLTIEELVRRMNAGLGTSSGIRVGVGPAEGLAAVAASVRVLSNTVSHLPLVLYEKKGADRMQARTSPLFSVLHDHPNPWQTSWQWRKLGMRDLMYRGNWYNFIVPGRDGFMGLIRLHPDTVTPHKDDSSGVITYEVNTGSGPKIYRADQILHVWLDSDDGLLGLDPIRVHRDSIGDGIAIREHGSKFFRNAARLGGLLQLEKGTSIDDGPRDALLADFDSQYTGGENAHRTAMLPAGVSFKEVSISMENAQWIEARKTTAREMFGIMGVPPHKGGDLADATYSNVEHENLGFVIDSITPIVVALEQRFNMDLGLTGSGMFVKFNMAALLRGAFTDRQAGLNIMRRAGIINANEWRELEDMNPRDDEGGEEYIVEQNMRPQDGTQPTEITSSMGAN
jgi:HK97 family phage portal protein